MTEGTPLMRVRVIRRELKEMYVHKCIKPLEVELHQAEKKLSEAKCKENEGLVNEITDLLLKKYPHLTKKLKCDYRKSEWSEDEIKLVFNAPVPQPDYILITSQLKLKIDQAKAALNKWEFEAVGSVASGMEIPEFKI